ncbi:MAG: AAA family ATPase [Patescibacteria group bacterium]
MPVKYYLKAAGPIFRSVKYKGNYTSSSYKFFSFGVWLLGISSIVTIIANYTFYPFGNAIGFSFMIFAPFLAYAIYSFYIKDTILEPKYPALAKINEREGDINLFDYISVDLAEKIWPLFKSGNVVSSMEFLPKLIECSSLNFIFLRLGINKDDFLAAILAIPKEEDITSTILKTVSVAIKNGHSSIWAGDILITLAEEGRMDKILDALKLEEKDLISLVRWQTKNLDRINEFNKRFDFKNPKLTGGIGRDWAYGYTLFLRQFAYDLESIIQKSGLGSEVVGREREMMEMEEGLLNQSNSNVVVVGEAGVGKKTTIIGFAKKILDGEVSPGLAHYHVFQLNIEALLSGSGGINETIANIGQVMAEASYAGNVIIFVENIDNLFSNRNAGQIDASEVLMPYLDAGNVRIIGTCDVAGYNNSILSNSALSSKFIRVSLNEPTVDQTIEILEDSVPLIEYRTKSIISYEALKEAVKLADKFIMDIPNPEKSIGLLEGASLRASSDRAETIVLPKDVSDYIESKYQIPLGEVTDKEREVLLALGEEMHKSVIGQNEAIESVVGAMRRARAQVTDSKKPIGSFLFLGPTGVGKTATAKALAKAYFGGEERMIRFDMSEYQNSQDIYRLIGKSFGGDEEQGNLVTAIREKPFSLLLFDEVEKADPDILNLFLQILDEGILTDGSGRKVSFANTIIIATSNAGADLIRESISNGENYEKTKTALVEYLQDQHIFRPELINRFSGVIAFSTLSSEEIRQVATIMFAGVQDTVYNNQGIKVMISPDAIDILSEMGFDQRMGARPMERIIQEKVENLLAEKILSRELKKGDQFMITKELIL